MLKTVPLKSVAIFIALWVIGGCASAPLDYPKEPSIALVDTVDGREANRVSTWLDGADSVNGFYPLTEGFDAFGTRLGLMSAAEYSIDAQYFLMKPDNAGLGLRASCLKPPIGECVSGCCWTTSLPRSRMRILRCWMIIRHRSAYL